VDRHRKINERKWNELISILRASMNSIKVPQKEQDEIIGIIGSTKGEVVLSSANP